MSGSGATEIGGDSSPTSSTSSLALAASPSSAGVDNKRRVVYDPSTNTRIVYRVVTPGEMKIGAASPWENASMTPLSSGHRSPIHLLFSLKKENLNPPRLEFLFELSVY